jgi:hypothetical protein
MSESRPKEEVQGEDPAFNPVDGTWNVRASVEERVREMELSIVNESIRHAALDFIGMAIDAADEERSDACVSEKRNTDFDLWQAACWRARLCEVHRSKMRVSVIGPINDDVRGALGAE